MSSSQHTDPTVALTCAMIERASVTPQDMGCQTIMAERLAAIGFTIEEMNFEDVRNVWMRRGQSAPLFAFAGHTDVVPTGPLDEWASDPFTPEIRDGLLYGRGAADMKGSLAAMVTAVESFVADNPDHKGSIALLITSDEEGPSINGTRKVIEALVSRDEHIDFCVVGEPSSSSVLGDTIKNGRRGSLGCTLTVKGQQGHVAYPQLADNPIHGVSGALAELCQEHWDEGDEYFPPTSLQVTNINAGTGADNVIPGEIILMFNLRYSPALNVEQIKTRIHSILDAHKLSYETKWRHSGEPFITQPGLLVNAMQDAVEAETGRRPVLSTAGGTSDGRFIAPTGSQVAELGPLNASIHKVNECVSVDDLPTLSRIYRGILQRLLAE